jgi:hypothetical protein
LVREYSPPIEERPKGPVIRDGAFCIDALQTPEQLLEQAQEHIRPLIGVIDRLNEANAEDELRVINRQLARLCFRVQPLPSD